MDYKSEYSTQMFTRDPSKQYGNIKVGSAALDDTKADNNVIEQALAPHVDMGDPNNTHVDRVILITLITILDYGCACRSQRVFCPKLQIINQLNEPHIALNLFRCEKIGYILGRSLCLTLTHSLVVPRHSTTHIVVAL